MKNERRNFIKTTALLSAGTLLTTGNAGGAVKELVSLFPMKDFALPPLDYPYNALEPYIDELTMKIHHDKHHQAYVTKLNELISAETSLYGKSLEELIKTAHTYPDAIKTVIRNQGGGHWNHTFFWTLLKTGTQPSATMQKVISDNFGSMEQFKKDFEKASMSVFGSGWAWVIRDGKKLSIVTTPNQDNPLMNMGNKQGIPVMGLDVWEHAYYLKYQNKRADYLQAFWNVLNWNRVEELYVSK